MTTSIFLGTSYNAQNILSIAAELGFTRVDEEGERMGMSNRFHSSISGLRIQVHSPSYLNRIDNILTEIEFDDITNQFPNHFQAKEVLKSLYEKVPDMIYLSSEPFKRPIKVAKLSEFFIN